jgi:hypothetical protein
MIALVPPPKVVPCDGWELIATEAGRYNNGLRATIQVWNGTLQDSRQLALAHRTHWTPFAEAVATRVGCTPDEIVQVLLTLTAGVEGILRQRTDGLQRTSHGKEPHSPVASAPMDIIAQVG